MLRGTDVVGDDVALVGELLFANGADAVLGDDLPVKQLALLPVRAQLPVSARMLLIFDAPDTHLSLSFLLWNSLPAAAGEGAVDRAELTTTGSHEVSPVNRS